MKKRTRRNARVDCAIRGKILGRHGYATGLVHNLSTGGLFFAGAHLAVDRQTEMTIDLDGQILHAVVEVLYRKASGSGAGVGVRFLRLGPDAESKITAYLAAHHLGGT
jgi:hypothetical protein